MTKKGILITFLIAGSALIFWLLWSGLWLERLRTFIRMPVHGKVWNNEKEKFKMLYPKENTICFLLGDSQIEQCEWQELIPEIRCANRGIGGESTFGLLDRISVLPEDGNNRTVILQTGINDLINGDEPDIILHRYNKILDYLKKRNYRPVVTLVFPVRYLKNINQQVDLLNSGIQRICGEKQCAVISINEKVTRDNLLSEEFTSDGLHLNYKGYLIWVAEIRKVLSLPPDSGCR
jgi:lysophospholipase L1-like esterase